MTDDDLDRQAEEIFARSQLRAKQQRKLTEVGVVKPIGDGCGSVRVNQHGLILHIEIELDNAVVAGEEKLARGLLDAVRKADAQARRVNDLIWRTDGRSEGT
jgi:hypothetical protein